MRERELLDERLAVAARREIGARPGDRLRAVEADDSAHDAVEQFVRAHAIDARRRFARKGLALADGALAERIAVEEGGGAVEQLSAISRQLSAGFDEYARPLQSRPSPSERQIVRFSLHYSPSG